MVPVTFRQDMINRVHISHVGIEACIRQARDCTFWPGMESEIRDYVYQSVKHVRCIKVHSKVKVLYHMNFLRDHLLKLV